MSWFGRKAAPAPAANGTKRQFSKEELNKATVNLQTALSKIANQHVLKYANDIRAQAKANANAARANAVATANPTPSNVNRAITTANQAAEAQQRVKKTEEAAGAVVNAVPLSGPVSSAVQNGENMAVNAVGMLIRNIEGYQTIGNLNKVKNNQRYQNASPNNKQKINRAVANKRSELLRPPPPL